MKLYAINLIAHPRILVNDLTGTEVPAADPAGWHEFCLDRFGVTHDFFLPDVRRVYRSRSAAVDRIKAVERWGGRAELLICDAEFLPEAEVKQARADLKKLERAAALREEADALEAEVDCT